MRCTAALVSVLLGSGLAAQPLDPGRATELLLRRHLETLGPSIVHLEAIGGGRSFGRPAPVHTGVVVRADGLILTAEPLIDGTPETILATFSDGRSLAAKTVAADRARGLLLLKVEAEALIVPEFAAPESIQPGTSVFALGRAFSRTGSPTVHSGIVSQTGRAFGRALQCDAATSPANYGGALIDLEGRVLGVVAALAPDGRGVGTSWYDSGVGFAATYGGNQWLEQLADGQSLDRAHLDLTTSIDDLGPGALVQSAGSTLPFDLRQGDRIRAVDGRPVQHGLHLFALVGALPSGRRIIFDIVREDGTEESVEGALPAPPSSARAPVTPSEAAHEFPWEGDPPPSNEQGR